MANPPKGIGGLINKALRDQGLGPRVAEVDPKKRWAEIIGPDLAHYVAPESLKHGELTVTVASAVWSQEIMGMQEQLLAQIRERMHSPAVQSLRVRIGRVPAPPPEKKPLVLPPVESLPEEIRAHLAKVEDPEVREVLTRFALRYEAKKLG